MVGQQTDIFDLGRLMLHSGEGRRLELSTGIDPFAFGGQDYRADPSVAALILDVSRTTSGYSLRLRLDVRLQGPCVRCLGEADHSVGIDAREVDQPGGGEEMDSPYVHGDELDVHAWARDALVLALPAQIVCSKQCLGLCAECGANLNEAGAAHDHDPPVSSRWAVLDELRPRLG